MVRVLGAHQRHQAESTVFIYFHCICCQFIHLHIIATYCSVIAINAMRHRQNVTNELNCVIQRPNRSDFSFLYASIIYSKPTWKSFISLGLFASPIRRLLSYSLDAIDFAFPSNMCRNRIDANPCAARASKLFTMEHRECVDLRCRTKVMATNKFSASFGDSHKNSEEWQTNRPTFFFFSCFCFSFVFASKLCRRQESPVQSSRLKWFGKF